MSDPTDRPLTEFDRQCLQAYQTWHMMGRPADEAKVAVALGIPRRTFSNRLLKYFLRDLGESMPLPILPGHEVKSHTQQFDKNGELSGQVVKTQIAHSDEMFEVPAGHRVKGESALIDAQGNVVQKWVKTTEGERSDEAVHDAAKLAAETYAGPAEPLNFKPWDQDRLDPLLLNLHQLPDLHIGLHADKVRAEIDWSLDGSVEVYKRLFRTIMERCPLAETGVILGGGDLLHFDDPTRMTRRSGNVLDGAQSYPTVLAAAENLLVYKVELALQRYKRVIVRILEGNHDPDSSIAIAHYLKAWFRNEPRVQVDADPSLFWFYEWGSVMLAATHGHEAKINQMPGIMAADRPEMWGRTKFRYAHGFHIHHSTKSAGEEGGCSWETHNTPVPRDDYHQGKGYRSARLLDVPTYHAETGWKGATVEVLA
ncbi:DNA methylase [Ruegeria phage vB_RpoS-V16]|uniref:DNA repair exonuclease n=1 Tax=Ruegeria phage vB_RpoS-V16 TaxID=2218618 RepID=UPI000DCADFF8|nr:DNA repair exonuclease [Ruegeria phage vB_RpoS-V16]AWY09472.1 DNA methylase [Ruegeria phage vB_RpoS-V16]